MKIIIFLVGLMLASQFIQAQSSIQAIKEHQKVVDARIESCIGRGSECSLYEDRFEINSGGKSWPAVGVFHSTQSRWYEMGNEIEENGSPVLLKINIITERSSRVEHEEFLFEGKELVFYHFSMIENELLQEYLFYFEKCRLVGYHEFILPEEKPYQVYKRSNHSDILSKGGDMLKSFQQHH